MSTQSEQARSIFSAAVENHSPDQWPAYLDEACGDDAQLRLRVEDLLRAHEKMGSFHDQGDATGSFTPLTEGPGTMIGRYKLMEQIGEGGMGVVYVAEQQRPVRRKVALKIIKPGMDTRDVIARFEAERQALALMDHPNIARVLDGGATDSGRPYFVMELVRGIPITEYCDRNKLSTRQRLGLFATVCQAIQHAHQKGIIHRDVKPSNVLVTLHDGTPVPKVIDFGVAKAINQQLTERTIYTRYAQMVGTPLYMSPEQAELSGLDVDTRTDVYSLGVLLYELLTGDTPFDKQRIHQAAYDEIRRIIREEEPPKPSTRISTLGETAGDVSGHRNTDPKRLCQLVRGDLDWIVMKALEKDRTRRYETANGFAADVRRYLGDEAVEACPPSTLYRVRKLVRRNKLVVAAAAAVSLSLMVGFAALMTGLVQAKWQADRADRLAERTQAALVETEAARGRQEREARRARKAERKAKEEALRAEKESEERRRQQYISDMNAAMLAWEESNIGEFDRVLDRYMPHDNQPDLRMFEWFHMRWLGEPYRQAGKIDVGDVAQNVAFIPGTKLLAVAHGYDTAVSLWNTETLETVRRFGAEGSAAWVDTFLAVSPDGQTIAYPGPDLRQVVLHNLTTGRERPLEFTLHDGRLWCAAFSPDGDLLAVGASDGSVKIWDLESDSQKGEFGIVASMSGESTQAIAFSPDGSLLAVGGGMAGEVKVWDIEAEKEKYGYQQRGMVRAVAFSPQGKFLASAGYGEELRICDLESRTDWPLIGHNGNVYCVAFSPDGSLLASGGVDRTIRLWNTADRSLRDVLKGHLGSVRGLSFSEDGKTLASASTDHMVLLWNVSLYGHAVAANVVEVAVGSPYNDRTPRIAFLPQGDTLAVLGRNTFRLLDCNTLQQQTTAVGLARPLRAMAVSESGLLALGDIEGQVELWSLETEELVRELPKLTEEVTSLTFSPDGMILAAGTRNGELKLWRMGVKSPWSHLGGHTGLVQDAAFRPDGKVLASVSTDGKVILWNVTSGERWYRLDVGYGASPEDVAFSPDGQTLAVAAFFRGVFLWDLSDTSRGPDVLKTAAASVLFSADGKTLFVGGAGIDPAIQVWDVASRRLRCRFTGHEASVYGLAMSPDGSTLVSTGRDLTVRFWRTAAGR